MGNWASIPLGALETELPASQGKEVKGLTHQLPVSLVGGCSWGVLTHQHSQPALRVVGALGSGQQVPEW